MPSEAAPITSEQIKARMDELSALQDEAERKAAAPFEKERASLVELCAGIGHQPGEVVHFLIDLDASNSGTCRVCAFCGTEVEKVLSTRTTAIAYTLLSGQDLMGGDWITIHG
jgi:hypothetical protein